MKTDTHYLTSIPREPLSEGRVLVHNHVAPQRKLERVPRLDTDLLLTTNHF